MGTERKKGVKLSVQNASRGKTLTHEERGKGGCTQLSESTQKDARDGKRRGKE